MTRRQAREAALCMLFDYGFHSEEPPEELLELYLDNYYDEKEKCISSEIRADNYFSKVYFGVISNLAEIDEMIERCSEKWSKKRISRISVSLLRIAVYEMIYMQDIPVQVSINEAVDLAKRFDTEDSYTFVNGVLGAAEKLLAARRTAGTEKKTSSSAVEADAKDAQRE